MQKLLFVDDDANMREVVLRVCANSSYQVDVAAGSENALTMIVEDNYPVVVTRLRMQGIDGLTLLVRIRALRPSTMFVVTTEAPELDLKTDDRIDDAIAAVIGRPWSEETFVESLRHAFQLYGERSKGDPASDEKFNLLIIDDDAQQILILKEILSGMANIVVCQRLELALTCLRERQFEVVVTKLSLPDARGLDAVTRVQRAQPESAVIVTSEIEDEKLATQAMSFGAQDYIHVNGLEPARLIRTVQFARGRKLLESRLVETAHYDTLTGLASRATLRERLSVCLAKARRQDIQCALFYVNIDQFRAVNDQYGHEVGDVVLQQVAARMRVAVREYDTVSRLDGDGFAVLIEDLADNNPFDVGDRILTRIRLPITIGQIDVRLGVSGGLVAFPTMGKGDTIDSLTRCAGDAMSMAKTKGRNRLDIYSA